LAGCRDKMSYYWLIISESWISSTNFRRGSCITKVIEVVRSLGIGQKFWKRGSELDLLVNSPLDQAISRMPATLLLIDDNAVQAATRQTILKRAGYFVIAALNPSRALEQIQGGEFPAEIGLVITDHVMPGMNGADFVRALRKTNSTVPVLVISGLAEAEDEYTGLNVTFRMKPLLPDHLLATVHGLVQTGRRDSDTLTAQ